MLDDIMGWFGLVWTYHTHNSNVKQLCHFSEFLFYRGKRRTYSTLKWMEKKVMFFSLGVSLVNHKRLTSGLEQPRT